MIRLGDVVLRRPEAEDVDALYHQKNDPEVAMQLGGFSTGYSREDLRRWVEAHRVRANEVLWVMASADDDRCLGHIGLYEIDYRIRSAEFAIMLGDRSAQGRGLGPLCSRFMLEYGFRELNLNRVSTQVLATNERSIHFCRKLGFREEGRLREAQYKGGAYIDVVLMSILRSELHVDDRS